jgi:hypothetical protein
VRLVADIKKDNLRLQAWDFISEDDIELRLWLQTHVDTKVPKKITLTTLDDAAWERILKAYGKDFEKAFSGVELPPSPKTGIEKFPRTTDDLVIGRAFLAPRGIGVTRWAQTNSKEDTLVRRRFALIGQTLDGQRVWDVRRACAVLNELFDAKMVHFSLEGKGEMASIALHGGLFEPSIESLGFANLPGRYTDGPVFLDVLRHFDMPQTLAIAFPKKIELVKTWVRGSTTNSADWSWPQALQKSLGKEYLGLHELVFDE